VASLVNGLTGSATAVGAAAAIARYGWLFPQLFTAYYAGRRRRRLPIYMAGAFGRVACLGLVSLLLVVIPRKSPSLAVGFFVLWTLHALVGGILAVPYNEIVARSIPSAERSRMLAARFLGGGLLLPLAGAALIELAGSSTLFAASAGAAGLPCVLVRRLRD